MRERLLGQIDEAGALDELSRLRINYDLAQSPKNGFEAAEGHWHVDSGTTRLGREGPGPPKHDGLWEAACHGDGPERVWGWCYQTLEGHLEQGRLSYEVIKHLTTGQVAFRVAGYSRAAPIGNPIVRLGFLLFGRWTQRRFYRNIQVRITELVRGAQRGRPLPSPAVRPDGIVLAPSGARPHRLERLAQGWIHPGS